MEKVFCPYCEGQAEFTDGKIIYGKNFGMIYLCRNCVAYVGAHKRTGKPLGRLANAELRYWKKAAHTAFDPLWQRGRFKGHRNVAYGWLAQRMNLPAEETHIGMFDIAQCKKVINIMRNERNV